MAAISQNLVDTLMELGLLESEAKVYSALVLRPGVKIKELQGLLGLSRPSIYASLRSLDERGFVDLVSSKPATYQAMPPELALDILTIVHRNAKERALSLFRSAEKEYMANALSSDTWHFIGNDGIEAKIKDMLDNARENVFCLTFGKYLDLIESRSKSNLDFQLVIVSDDRAIQEHLGSIFKKYKARIQMVKKSRITDTLINNIHHAGARDRRDLAFEKVGVFSMDSMFVLNVDDKEVFVIPPMPPDNIKGGMATKNKSLILYQKLMMKMLAASELCS